MALLTACDKKREEEVFAVILEPYLLKEIRHSPLIFGLTMQFYYNCVVTLRPFSA